MFVPLRGEPYVLWRAVDQHGAELDILLQKHCDKIAAKRFFKRVLAACPSGTRRSPPTGCLHRPRLDRLRHNAYCLELDGPSYRDPKVPPRALCSCSLAREAGSAGCENS